MAIVRGQTALQSLNAHRCLCGVHPIDDLQYVIDHLHPAPVGIYGFLLEVQYLVADGGTIADILEEEVPDEACIDKSEEMDPMVPLDPEEIEMYS